MKYIAAKDMKAAVAALKRIYQSAAADEALAELDALEAEWGERYRAVVQLWRGNWDNIIPFFQFPPEIRKMVYTTNAIESSNMSLRKLTHNRRISPNDEAALQTFQIMFEERVPLAALQRKPKLHSWMTDSTLPPIG